MKKGGVRRLQEWCGDMKLCNYFSRRSTKENKKKVFYFSTFKTTSTVMHTIVGEILKNENWCWEWAKIYLIFRCNLLHSTLVLFRYWFAPHFPIDSFDNFSFSLFFCSAHRTRILFNNPSEKASFCSFISNIYFFLLLELSTM